MVRNMARRYGTGRAYKRGERWWTDVQVDGRRQRESCGSAVMTKAEAQRVLRQRIRVAEGGVSVGNLTVSDLVDMYLADQRANQRKSIKVATYKAEILRGEMGDKVASKISATDIKRLRAKLAQRGKTTATVNRFRSIWLRMFTLAAREGYTIASPYWPPLKENPPRRVHISLAEFERIAARMEQPYRTIARIAYVLGCRMTEIRTLEWRFLEPDRSMAILPETKNDSPREIPLPPTIIGEIQALELQRDREWPASPWVFTLDGSKPVTDKTLRKRWKAATEAEGLGHVWFHSLRHIALSNLRRAEVEEGTIMSISGHKSPATFRRYGIQPESLRRKAVQLVDFQKAQNRHSADETEPIKPN